MKSFLEPASWLFLLPLLGLFVSGCSDRAVPFEHITRGGLAEAGVWVFRNDVELQDAWDELRGVGPRPEIDWEEHVVIGVFLGERPTGGYAVEVEEVRVHTTGRVRIDVQTTSPGPDDFVTLALTYPGELIQVSRRHLPTKGPWQLEVWETNQAKLFDTRVEGTV